MSESKHSLDDAALRLNLSYVLHESSQSHQVRRASRDSRRFQRGRRSLLERFQRLSDQELSSVVSTTPGLSNALTGDYPALPVLTASAGLPELLQRTVRVVTGPGIVPEISINIDDWLTGPSPDQVQLFAAPATLPRAAVPESARGVLVAGLVVRPGERSLLLTGELVELTDVSIGESGVYSARVIGAIEDLIRDYVDQWTPRRPLWNAPAEHALPELRTGARRERSA